LFCSFIIQLRLGFASAKQNPNPNNQQNRRLGASRKLRSEKGAESSFCLWQELKSTNEKIAKNGDRSEFFHIMAHLYEFARTHFNTKN
jgi:hypothetical protein